MPAKPAARLGGFHSLGDFALRESERSYSYLDSGFGGLPEHAGIVQRFDAYATGHRQTDGVRFLRSAISYVKDQLGLDQDAFLFEMVSAFLGSTYPTPPRMLGHTEEIVKAYLTQEMFGTLPPSGEFSVFATEGGTAAMTYFFESLRANSLIEPGDKIAIATPIFALSGNSRSHRLPARNRRYPLFSRVAKLTRKLTLRHSADADSVHASEAALDVSKILLDWGDVAQSVLLERALFGFASYGRVRFTTGLCSNFLPRSGSTRCSPAVFRSSPSSGSCS